MKEEEKETYFKQARELELLHKSQYPGYKYVPGASKIEKTMKKRGYDQSTFVENYKYLINRPVDNHPLRYSFAKPSNLPNPHLPTQFSGPRMRFNYGYRPKLDKTSGYCPRPSYPKTAPGIGPTPGHTHTCTCTHDRKPGSSQDEASVERPMFYTMSGDDNVCLSTPENPSLVMMPVDAKFAEMLGWPPHMLQAVPQWMEEIISPEMVDGFVAGPNTLEECDEEAERSFEDGTTTDSDTEVDPYRNYGSLPDLGSQQLFRADIDQDLEEPVYKSESHINVSDPSISFSPRESNSTASDHSSESVMEGLCESHASIEKSRMTLPLNVDQQYSQRCASTFHQHSSYETDVE